MVVYLPNTNSSHKAVVLETSEPQSPDSAKGLAPATPSLIRRLASFLGLGRTASSDNKAEAEQPLVQFAINTVPLEQASSPSPGSDHYFEVGEQTGPYLTVSELPDSESVSSATVSPQGLKAESSKLWHDWIDGFKHPTASGMGPVRVFFNLTYGTAGRVVEQVSLLGEKGCKFLKNAMPWPLKPFFMAYEVSFKGVKNLYGGIADAARGNWGGLASRFSGWRHPIDSVKGYFARTAKESFWK